MNFLLGLHPSLSEALPSLGLLPPAPSPCPPSPILCPNPSWVPWLRASFPSLDSGWEEWGAACCWCALNPFSRRTCQRCPSSAEVTPGVRAVVPLSQISVHNHNCCSCLCRDLCPPPPFSLCSLLLNFNAGASSQILVLS